MNEAAAANFLNRYAAAWQCGAAGAIAEHWEAKGFAFYKAEEIRSVFTRWTDLVSYWKANERLHEQVKLEFSALTPVSGTDLLFADMDWHIRFRADAVDECGARFRHAGRAMAGFTKVLMLFGEEGRLHGWAEMPDAPPIYLADLYYRLAGDRT